MAKTAKHREMDMLHGGLAGRLILFALPLAFSSILQQLFNSADVAVVGRFAGDAALAAVGSCVALVGIFVNLIVGLSVGPNAVLALLIGQNSRDEINRTLHTVLTFGAALGAGLMLVGWLSARPILVLSGTPESVLDEALLYIFIYFLSIPFMVVYNFGAGDIRRCKRIFRLCLLFGIVFTEILSAVFMVWDDFFVSIYTSSSAVAVFAVSRMRHVCSLEGLTATYEVESASLRGMGRSLEPAVFTILGTVVFRLIWMATVFRLFPTYEMLMNVYPASWIFTGAALLIVYVRQMRRTARSV